METGRKIKRIANIFFWVSVVIVILGVLGGMIAGIVMSDREFGFILLSILGAGVAAALGIFFAWVIKTFIMGYGELVENSAIIRENTAPKA